jgi:cyclopropane fatty-acyl-phospholipid synthase-like methyltransferase
MTGIVTPPAAEAVRADAASLHGPLRDLHDLLREAKVACELTLADGRVIEVGDGPPKFGLRFHTPRPFGRGLDERAIAESYVAGEFDVEGDMLSAFDVRSQLVDAVPLGQFLRIWLAHFLRPRTAVNRNAIDFHYSLGDDFYLTFLDSAYRIYTHAIYRDESESLEAAADHKMEQAFRSVRAQPGMRVLNIGAGWGPTEQYFGSRGVHVTGLTIGEDSRDFVQRLIDRERLTAEVKLEDFLVHEPAQPYDAIVILGVIEHIPDYRRFARRVWQCLRPGGLIYLDASASREKYTVGSFAREYIWTGTHTYLCLQDLVREFLYHGIDVVEVANETRDYGLTCAEWARRFDAVHDEIAARWGEAHWRAWRLYLWGGAHAFLRNDLQAYHVLGRRTDSAGPRPGWMGRAKNAIKSVL